MDGTAGVRIRRGLPGRTAGQRQQFHAACPRQGARRLFLSDSSAPLDARLRVKGVEGLWVADGSVTPDLISVNPCITTMMIGEKCADLLKEDR
ncbi:GMC oxidoreductase [Streptomyces mirabilis]|uniref:GMC oxidoreductase n=1 Tax=Streptomyces mirabilis TaxID=68239 RepID=UPI00338D7B05